MCRKCLFIIIIFYPGPGFIPRKALKEINTHLASLVMKWNESEIE